MGLPARVQYLLLAIAAAAIGATFVHDAVLRVRLRQARRRELAAIDRERRRVVRALGEGAHHRLVRAQAELTALAAHVPVPGTRDEIAALADELDAALDEIRSITLDEALGLLRQEGLPAALGAVARFAPFDVSVKAEGFHRYPAVLERAMYFCCVEALQNVGKHAGPGARARIRLVERPASVLFSVADSGVGFDIARPRSGMGMSNLADRLELLGGRLRVHTRPGCGTCVRGEVPVPPAMP